jgi:ankyrin repeat protein
MESLVDYVFTDDLNGLQDALRRGVDVNERDADGRTALTHAVLDNKVESVRLLLMNGADSNLRDKLGNAPLHYSAQEQLRETTQLLIAHGATIDIEICMETLHFGEQSLIVKIGVRLFAY